MQRMPSVCPYRQALPEIKPVQLLHHKRSGKWQLNAQQEAHHRSWTRSLGVHFFSVRNKPASN